MTRLFAPQLADFSQLRVGREISARPDRDTLLTHSGQRRGGERGAAVRFEQNSDEGARQFGRCAGLPFTWKQGSLVDESGAAWRGGCGEVRGVMLYHITQFGFLG